MFAILTHPVTLTLITLIALALTIMCAIGALNHSLLYVTQEDDKKRMTHLRLARENLAYSITAFSVMLIYVICAFSI